jgi:hypothetical protein
MGFLCGMAQHSKHLAQLLLDQVYILQTHLLKVALLDMPQFSDSQVELGGSWGKQVTITEPLY